MKKSQMFLMGFLGLVVVYFVTIFRGFTLKKIIALGFSFLNTGYLFSVQESNPLWIKANQEIKDFRVQFQLPILTASQIKEWEQQQNDLFAKSLQLLPLKEQCSKLKKQQQFNIKQEIFRLFKKHGIDSSVIKIMYVSLVVAKEVLQRSDVPIGVIGNTCIIVDSVAEYSKEQIIACAEQAIGHLIFHDMAYLAIASCLIKGPYADYLNGYYLLILQQRAGIYSGMQSKENFESLCIVGCDNQNSIKLKLYKIAPRLQQIVPQIMKNPEVPNMLTSYVDPLAFETITNIAEKEFKAGNISLQVLTEVIELCNQPTYMNELASFYKQQKSIH